MISAAVIPTLCPCSSWTRIDTLGVKPYLKNTLRIGNRAIRKSRSLLLSYVCWSTFFQEPNSLCATPLGTAPCFNRTSIISGPLRDFLRAFWSLPKFSCSSRAEMRRVDVWFVGRRNTLFECSFASIYLARS
jgi:hypothetical protein